MSRTYNPHREVLNDLYDLLKIDPEAAFNMAVDELLARIAALESKLAAAESMGEMPLFSGKEVSLSENTSREGRDCKHGHLARACEICELEAKLAATQQRLAEAEDLIDNTYAMGFYTIGAGSGLTHKDLCRKFATIGRR